MAPLPDDGWAGLLQRLRQMKPNGSPKQLGRQIAILLTVKAVVIAALFFAFFSPSHRLHPTEETVSAHLLGGNDK